MYSYSRTKHTTYRRISRAVMQAAPVRAHVYVTSTTGGGHATHSLHYLGMGVDFGSKSQAYKDKLAAWLYPLSKYINELIHTKASGGGWYVKNGRRVKGSFYGSTIVRQHINHVHLGMTEAGYKAMIKDPYFKKYLKASHGKLSINLDELDDTEPDETNLPDTADLEDSQDGTTVDNDTEEGAHDEAIEVDGQTDADLIELEDAAADIANDDPQTTA
jgi:hypothetical protein